MVKEFKRRRFTGIAAFGLNAGFTNQAGHAHFPSPSAPSLSEEDTGGSPQLESVGDYSGAPANTEAGGGI
ncbi:hypothetical protein JDS87_24100 [Bacillus cereus]|nr:hypothetical protein [Bacillus cereus]MBJ8054946.1 hypothetical protein [Bacillus cereus]